MSKPDPAAERVLGDFRIVCEIGRGGMGVVYEAEQISLARRVALKVLPAHITIDPRSVERFEREAKAAARLRHPGIVEIYAVGEDAGTHYFAMERIDGTPLNVVIERMRQEGFDALTTRPTSTPSPHRAAAPSGTKTSATSTAAQNKAYIETVVKLVASIADALDYAHGQGIIHRDVKPSNILVRADGSPTLMDFGIAREQGLPSVTLTGEFAGTPYYVSPEQAMSTRMKLDHRTDVFSLGVTLYELLTLERPFPGDDPREVLGRIITKEPLDPQKLNPRLAPDLATIVLKALEKDPDRRYATAGAMAEDLRAFLEYRPIAARRASVRTRLMRFARREPAKATLLAVLLLGIPLVAGLGGWVIAKAPEIRAASEQARLDRIERHLEEGFLQLGEGTPENAIAAFEAALAIEPYSAEAIAGTALALMRSGRADEALEFLAKHPVDASIQPALDRLRVDALRAAGRTGEASDLEARLGEPQGALALFLEGSRELRAGKRGEEAAFARALVLLNRAVLMSPHARALFHIERAHAAGHAKDGKAAKESVDALRALWPDSVGASLMAGFALLSSGDVDGSIVALGRAIEIDPNCAEAYNNLGEAYFRAGNFQESIRACRRSIEIDPATAFVHINLANALRASGDLTGAIAEYRRAIERDPKDARGHYGLGNVLRDSGDLKGAIAECRRAIEIDPRYLPARVCLEISLIESGDREGAIAEYRRTIEIDPKHWPTEYIRGNGLHAEGNFNGAVTAYRLAIEMAPKFAFAHYGLGRSLRASGDLEGAIAAYRRAIEIDPNYVQAHHGLGRSLRATGDLEGAIAAYRRAIEIDPKQAASHSNLRDVLAASGDLTAARSVLERWTRLRPDDAQAWNALAWFLVGHDGKPEQRDAVAGLAAARKAAALSEENDPAILDTLAEALFLSGDSKTAVDTEEQALRVLTRGPKSDESMRASLEASLARFRAAAAATQLGKKEEDR